MSSGCPPESEEEKFGREQKEKALLESIKDIKHVHLIYDLKLLDEQERLRVAEFIEAGAPMADMYDDPITYPIEKRFIIDN